ncbi:hypothetical protein [Microbacterium enclense]|uniref:hypothetical protein n=1 Tax=Microbacterium enclense TaxID=993073 RepID=UPI003F81FA87
MDQLYLPITLVLAAAAIIRIPTVIRQPHARPAWFATALAMLALMTRGSLIPIQTLDAWLGDQNLIFLVQCWLATFAFWVMCEAAGADTRRERRASLRLWIPSTWCVVFTVPFFLIQGRKGTDLFFIDAHLGEPSAIVCGILYMLGITGSCGRLLVTLRGRPAAAHWFFRIGASCVVVASLLWCASIVIAAHQTPIDWMGTCFDSLFYPGVVIMALGLVTFAIQRQARRITMQRRVSQLRAILSRNDVIAPDPEQELPLVVFDLLVRIKDARTIGLVSPTIAEAKVIAHATAWVDRAFPQIASLSTANGASS